MSWANYDYRGISAGVILMVLAGVAFWVNPTTTLRCARDTAQCVVVERSGTSRTERKLALSDMEAARRECDHRLHSGECAYTVALVVRGKGDKVFTDIEGASEALALEAGFNSFLADPAKPFLQLSRHGDRTWVYVLAATGLVLIALGIRKNLQDHGYTTG